MSGRRRPARRERSVIRNTVTICNERGLHARAAATFVNLAGRYDAEVTVSKDGQSVSGGSILGLMMLAAGPGVEIELRAWGPQAGEAIGALGHMIEAGFEEDR